MNPTRQLLGKRRELSELQGSQWDYGSCLTRVDNAFLRAHADEASLPANIHWNEAKSCQVGTTIPTKSNAANVAERR